MTTQKIIVIALFIVAFVYITRRIYKSFKSHGADSGCGSCPVAEISKLNQAAKP